MKTHYLKRCFQGCSLLFILLELHFIVLPAYHSQDMKTQLRGCNDFVRAYVASQLADSPRPEELYQPDLFLKRDADYMGQAAAQGTPYGWSYPPVYSLVLHFLSRLPLKQALALYAAFQMGAFFLAGFRFLWFTFGDALLLCSSAVLFSLSWGQNGVLLAAFYIAAFRFMNTKPWLSGVFFACGLCKPQLGLLVPILLLAGRFHKVFIAACIAGLAFIGLSLLFYGEQSWIAYGHSLLAGFSLHSASVGQAAASIADVSNSYHMPTVFNMFASYDLPPSLCTVVQLCFAAYCVYRIALAARQPSARPLLLLLEFSLLSPLVSPYYNIYDYVLCVSAAMAYFLIVHPPQRLSIAGITVLLLLNTLFITGVLLAKQGIIVTPLIVWLSYEYTRLRIHTPGRKE